jgi:hypothetical protein
MLLCFICVYLKHNGDILPDNYIDVSRDATCTMLHGVTFVTQQFGNYFVPSVFYRRISTVVITECRDTAVVWTVSLTLSVTWRQHRVPCCRSVTVHRHSFLISAAYSKPSSFTVSEFFLETLIHVRRPSSVSSVVHLVTKPLILPVFVREWLQKYRPLQCGVSSLKLAPFFCSSLVAFVICFSFFLFSLFPLFIPSFYLFSNHFG